MKALVIVPAFNEGVKLRTTAERIRSFFGQGSPLAELQALILDDCSTEPDTRQIAEEYGFQYLRNPQRMGVGYSLRRAYEHGLEEGFDILVTMAGNNKDNPAQIDRLLEPIVSGNADFVQGSRYLPGGNWGNMPFYRQVTTRIIHPVLFSLAAGKRITDSTNGFRAFRASLLKDTRINLRQSWLNQYELEPYLFCKAIHYGWKVTEVPVSKIYPDKKLGYSKMKPITGWWSILKPVLYLLLRLK